jgi:hypothetical protein
MKITIVLGAFFPVPPTMGGGVEKVWFSLAPEFVKRGHDVVMVSRKMPGLPREETIGGVKHLRVDGFDTPRSLVWLKFLDLIYSDDVDPAGRGHHRDEHVLASDFAPQFQTRARLRSGCALSERSNAFLRQSGAITGSVAGRRPRDCCRSPATRARGFCRSKPSAGIANCVAAASDC